MPGGQSAGYLPGDPRYGLQVEALKDYYRTKPAQWAIYCWDKPGMEATRRAEQNSYVKNTLALRAAREFCAVRSDRTRYCDLPAPRS